MNNLGTEFRVGVFTLLGLAATIFAIFVVSPNLFETEDKNRYHTILKDAAGILPKTQVKTNGVTIGKVVTVELDRHTTKVTFEIKKDVAIPEGSTVEVRTVGFLGDKFIEIHRADGETNLPPGSLIPRDEDKADLNEVISMVGNIATDIKKVTTTLANVLGEEKGERSLATIVENIERISSDARDILGDNKEDVRRLIANLKTFSTSLNDVLKSENREKVDRILAALDESMLEVKGATKSIRLVAEKVEKGEGTMGRLFNDDKTLEELEGAIKEIRSVLAPASKLQIAVDYHGEARQGNETQNYFNLHFHTRPDAYYTLGFTDKVNDVITTETETLPDGTVRETKKTERALRFNLQFAKRWYWAALRFGLFESTGGIASDLYFWKDRVRLSMEAFEFAGKDDENRDFAHLKTYASVLFFNHLYAMAGVDDWTRKDPLTDKRIKEPKYFFGAGVTFNDQDLKALFGAASIAGAAN